MFKTLSIFLLFLFLLPPFMYFVLFIHETGHFLACKLLKVDVSHYRIGEGKSLLKIKTRNTLYKIKACPLSGEIFHYDTQNDIIKLIISFAGSAVELAFALVFFCISNRLPSTNVSTIILETYTIVLFTCAVVNLSPSIRKQKTPSDGDVIWSILTAGQSRLRKLSLFLVYVTVWLISSYFLLYRILTHVIYPFFSLV